MLNLHKIHPLSEFQRGAKIFLERLKQTQSPIFLTVNDKAAVVIPDVGSYQKLLDRIELLESLAGIRKSMEEFDQGKGQSLGEAFQQLREKYDMPD